MLAEIRRTIALILPTLSIVCQTRPNVGQTSSNLAGRFVKIGGMLVNFCQELTAITQHMSNPFSERECNHEETRSSE